jgi:hypothetical protein
MSCHGLGAAPTSFREVVASGAGGALAAGGERARGARLRLLLLLLLISALIFFSSSRALLISFSPLPSAASAEPLFVEANLRKQMRAEECPARGAVPRTMLRGCGGSLGGAWRTASIARGRVHRQAGVQQGWPRLWGMVEISCCGEREIRGGRDPRRSGGDEWKGRRGLARDPRGATSGAAGKDACCLFPCACVRRTDRQNRAPIYLWTPTLHT